MCWNRLVGVQFAGTFDVEQIGIYDLLIDAKAFAGGPSINTSYGIYSDSQANHCQVGKAVITVRLELSAGRFDAQTCTLCV